MKLVFVSSTFKDMQFERDMLHTHVIPLLDTKLTKYGESVRFGDLRWGVNTTEYSEEESSKKVLKVCLDQIDDCKPYMIVFIGERYGWIPSQDLIKNAAVFKGIDNIEYDISVTQLEIEYGALLNPDYEGRILFYFRNLDKEGMTEEERKTYEAESPLHEQKILSLKEKIYKLYPNFVRSYNAKWNKETKKVENLDPLMDLIKEDLEKIFTYDIEKNNSLDWQERAILASHEFYKEKNKVYVNTKTIVRKLNKDLEKGNNNSGLLHIIKNHKDNFKKAFNISENEIPNFLKNVMANAKIVSSKTKIINGKQGYERKYEYNNKYIIVSVIGTNGFIVSAYPREKR